MNNCPNDGKKLLIHVFLFTIILLLSSCAAIQKYLDNSGMESSYESIIKDYNPGSLVEFSSFVKNFSLAQSTAPFDPGIPEHKPIGDWELKSPKGATLTQEKLVINTPVSGLTYPEDKLVLYIYRQGEVGGKRAFLFAPGMGVSNFALMFLKNIFAKIIKRGYILVVYVPPYHLDRVQPGKDRGEGFFTADSSRNIGMIAACTSEIRTAVRYLKSKGALDVAAWGGSLGASFLLLSSEYEYYSHLTVMIPVMDLNSALLDNPEMKGLKDRLIADGYSGEMLRQAYSMVSPIKYKTLTPPDKMLILFARYDQLTPMTTLESYRKSHGNPCVIIYDRSHATILTASAMYDDYAIQLNAWGE